MRKIIITTQVQQSNYIEIEYVFRLSIPVAQQSYRVDVQATSLAPSATVGETTEVQQGLILEKSGTSSYSTGSTSAQIGADLVSKFNAEQANLNASKQFKFYGSFWDGTSWTIQGA